MSVTYHPNGYGSEKRPTYLVVDSFSNGVCQEKTFPVRNMDSLGAILLAYQTHQDLINRACFEGVLPQIVKIRYSNASISTIVSGLRAQILSGSTAKGKATNFYPAFTVNMLRKNNEHTNSKCKVFYIHRLGYNNAWEQAVKMYASDRQLSNDVERMLIECIPDKSLFTEYLSVGSNLTSDNDIAHIQRKLDRVCDRPHLMPREHDGAHIAARGLMGRINHINGVAVSLAFVVRLKRGGYWQSAIVKHGYDGAYKRAVEKYAKEYSDKVTSSDKQWLLAQMPDKSAFSDHLIPTALEKGSINECQAKKLLVDLGVLLDF